MGKILAGIAGSLLVCIGMFLSGYHQGYKAKEASHALEKEQLVTTVVKEERAKQEAKEKELVVARKSQSDLDARYRRVLQSQGRTHTNLQSCIGERNRLRESLKEGFGLVITDRRIIEWCRIQLSK